MYVPANSQGLPRRTALASSGLRNVMLATTSAAGSGT